MRSVLTPEDFYAIADTLGIIVVDEGVSTAPLRGQSPVKLRLMEALDFTMSVSVVDSGVYVDRSLVGVAVQLCGALHAVLLVDPTTQSADRIQLWLVDRSKLAAGSTFTPFPVRAWSRRKFYEAFMEGVVCGYKRASCSSAWIMVPDAKAELKHYVASKSDAVVVNAEFSSISSKYRTKGPRD